MKEPQKPYISNLNHHYPQKAEFQVVGHGGNSPFGVIAIDTVIKLMLTHEMEGHNILFLYQLRHAVEQAFNYYINDKIKE